jgi:hypothetical protein
MSSPILSAMPSAIKSLVSISINWYLIDELPQFSTKIFIYILMFVCFGANNDRYQIVSNKKGVSAKIPPAG